MKLAITGLREAEEALARLGPVAGAKVMRQAMFFATKPILNDAKQRIAAWPGGSGALALAMGRTFKTTNAGATGSRFVMQIGPRRKPRTAVALHNLYYRRNRRGIFYGHLLEFGHRIGHRKSGYLTRAKRKLFGAPTGNVPAQPFLRPALIAAGGRASEVLKVQLFKRIERALRKQDPATPSP